MFVPFSEIYAEELRISVETVETEVIEISTFILNVFFRNNPVFQVFVNPFPVKFVVVVFLTLPQRIPNFPIVQLRFICKDLLAPGIMSAFKNKPVWKLREIYVFGVVPHTKIRNYILFSQTFGDNPLDLIFINQPYIFGISVMEFEPVHLLVERPGVFQIRRISENSLEFQLYEGFVIQLVIKTKV